MRNCTELIKNLLKKTNRVWLKKQILVLQRIKNKTPKQENKLCSLSHTLAWIPFENENNINNFCKNCDFHDIHNSYFE